jgi:hypothetical protein
MKEATSRSSWPEKGELFNKFMLALLFPGLWSEQILFSDLVILPN